MIEFPNIVGLGEALFDVYPDGREVVGGAPLNFAVHAHRLARVVGKSATIVSRAGTDKRGAAIRAFLSEAGMAVDFLEEDPRYPTGQVPVTLDSDGQASYEIVSDVAWDYIE